MKQENINFYCLYLDHHKNIQIEFIEDILCMHACMHCSTLLTYIVHKIIYIPRAIFVCIALATNGCCECFTVGIYPIQHTRHAPCNHNYMYKFTWMLKQKSVCTHFKQFINQYIESVKVVDVLLLKKQDITRNAPYTDLTYFFNIITLFRLPCK